MEHTRTINRAFETGEKAVLHIESHSGSVSVEAHDGAAVLLEAIVHVWSDIAAEADDASVLVERAMEQDGHRVIVRAPVLPDTEGWRLWGGKRGSRVDYNVRVPLRTAVRVISRSGRVQIGGTEGRVHVESQSGRCTIAGVRGDVLAIARSGSVTIERITGNVDAEARSGRVEVRDVTGSAAVKAKSGIADVRDISGDVKIEGHTGLITIEHVGGRLQVIAHTGTVRYSGQVLADIDIKAHTGGIHLSVDPAHPFFIDAESQIGTVRSDLAPRRNGAAGPAPDGPKVRLRTHTGSIRLSRL